MHKSRGPDYLRRVLSVYPETRAMFNGIPVNVTHGGALENHVFGSGT